MNYLVAEANYGGRVTDDKDGRLIRAMLRRYLCPEVMNDNYKLSKLDIYYAPPEGSLAETRAYIEGSFLVLKIYFNYNINVLKQ